MCETMWLLYATRPLNYSKQLGERFSIKRGYIRVRVSFPRCADDAETPPQSVSFIAVVRPVAKSGIVSLLRDTALSGFPLLSIR